MFTVLLFAIGGLLPSAAMAKQRVTYSVDGECWTNNEDLYLLELYEEYGDECYFEVVVSKPKTLKRTTVLQYWDDDEGLWLEEDRAITNRSGRSTLWVSNYCGEGEYCDGTWTYRIAVLKKGKEKARYSSEVDITFYPLYL